MTENRSPYKGPDGRFFQPGNPGRPRGSKHKLGVEFFDALYRDFVENGVAVIAKVRENRPTEYLRVAAMVIPKEMTIVNETGQFSHLSDEELAQLARQEAAALGIEFVPTAELSGPEARPRGGLKV